MTRNNFDIKVDQNFSSRDQAFFRFSRHNTDQDVPGSLPVPAVGNTAASLSRYPLHQFVGSYTRTLTPSVINEFRAGVTRLNIEARHPNWGRDVSEEVGIAGVNVAGDPLASGLTRVNLTAFEGLGDSGGRPAVIISENYQLNDALTWIRGAHTFKFGGEFGRRRYNLFQDSNLHGNLNFGPIYTTNPAAAADTGSSLGDLLLGAPQNGTIAYLSGTRGYRRSEAGLFAQDTWKMTPSLTLNLGLRYEIFASFPWTEVADRMAYFRPERNGVFVVGSPEVPERSGTKTDFNNFGPRIGAAYKLGQRTVFRAAWGMFFSAEAVPATSLGGANPPFTGSFAFNNDQFNFEGARRVSQGFVRPASLVFSPLGASLQSVDPNMRTPYVQQWNAGIQHVLPAQFLLAVSYVGTSGTKLILNPDINQPVPGASAVATRRPFPSYNSIRWLETGGSSNYHSLQASVERRFTQGLNLLVSYTWAHAIDTGDFSIPGRTSMTCAPSAVTPTSICVTGW